MILISSSWRMLKLLPRRNKIQILLSVLFGLAVVVSFTLENNLIGVIFIVVILLLSVRFRPVRFYSTSIRLLALSKAKLYGYKGDNKDLKYLVYRSSDAIEYLLKDFAQSSQDIDEFLEQNNISKTGICFDESAKSQTWNDEGANKVASLARYLVLSQISIENVFAGLNLYQRLLKESKNKVFRIRLVEPHLQHQKVFLDGLIIVGAFDEWRSTQGELLRQLKISHSTNCDSANPFIQGNVNKLENAWLKKFNEYFNVFGLEEIKILASGTSPFDRLSTSAMPKVQGPLVSVIVSTFNPGPELVTAIQSLISQTWERIEIIIVDDFSTQTEFIDHAKSLDPRIKIVRQSENLGTYAARNLGIRNSSGEFITTHDSDDWAHPQRIELQAKNLLSKGKIHANLSWGLRVSSDLRVSTLGFSETRVNASSLMFKRQLIEEVGFFDEVRKGADSEFRLRILAKFPGSLSVVGFQPLSIVRIGHESLSRMDFSPLWTHPDRHFYRHCYETWHKSAKLTDFRILSDAKSYRLPFPCPVVYLNVKDSPIQKDFDVIYAANFSNEYASRNLGIKRLTESIHGQEHIGVLNLKSLQLNEAFDPEFQRLISAEKIYYVSQDNFAPANKLVIIDPEFLLLRSALPQLLDPQAVEIQVTSLQRLLNHFQKISGTSITLNDKSEVKTLISKIQENTFTLYGKHPAWMFALEDDLDLINSLGIEDLNLKV
jgi:glycosyltransferase involved in cell wall biosynthesis